MAGEARKGWTAKSTVGEKTGRKIPCSDHRLAGAGAGGPTRAEDPVVTDALQLRPGLLDDGGKRSRIAHGQIGQHFPV